MAPDAGDFDAGDLFAMPCRTRRLGLQPEALGIVFLEASACGLPVLVGDSGGASETVLVEETGYVVSPRETDELATWVCKLLRIRRAPRNLAGADATWVEREWTWGGASQRLDAMLELTGEPDEPLSS